ncbi:fimbrial protein [Serratia fonticola]|uniref:fimbrial protein n=1 Tax=Serratia fonticola TaxID=47917 RepID=UPI003AABAA4D
MKLNKFLVAAASFGFAASAFAVNPPNEGRGTIDFRGAIIQAPCSIDETKSTKEVNLGQVSDVLLADGGKSTPQDIKIVLADCTVGVKNKVKTTITGPSDAVNADLLGITGTAAGAGIAIVDGSGTVIKMGEATPFQTLSSGENVLKFSAYLQGGAADTIKPGTFTSTATWSLTYE